MNDNDIVFDKHNKHKHNRQKDAKPTLQKIIYNMIRWKIIEIIEKL